jgi:hypothetical protein
MADRDRARPVPGGPARRQGVPLPHPHEGDGRALALLKGYTPGASLAFRATLIGPSDEPAPFGCAEAGTNAPVFDGAPDS